MPLDFQLLSQAFHLLHHGHVRRVHVHHDRLHRRGQSGHHHRGHLHHDRLHHRDHGHRGRRDHGRHDYHRQQGMSDFVHPFPNGFQDLRLRYCNSAVC